MNYFFNIFNSVPDNNTVLFLAILVTTLAVSLYFINIKEEALPLIY